MFALLNRFTTFFFGQSHSPQLRELYVSTAILDFAATAVMIFEPIYLTRIGFSLERIVLFYMAIYLLFFLFVPLGGKLIRSRGYEHGIIYSTPFLILYYLSLFAIPYSPVFIGTAVIALAIQKICYWPGYRADFARFGDGHQTGRDISAIAVLALCASILGPIFGGLIIAWFGFPVLFLCVSVIILLSNVPLLLTPEVFTPRTLSYRDAWKRLWKRENRRNFFAYMGCGEEMIALIFWPIFMYAVVRETLGVGAIASVATAVTALVTLAIGRMSDGKERGAVLRMGVVYVVLSWLVRLVAVGPFGLFFSDVMYRSSGIAVGIPLVAGTYDHARQYSVTKTAVFMEGAVSFGKVVAAVLCLVILTFFPSHTWTLVFMLAAAFALLYALYKPDRDVAA